MGIGTAIGAAFGLWASNAAWAGAAAGLFGVSVGQLWLVGASIGSIFDQQNSLGQHDSPSYTFGPIRNTKSQLLPVPIVYGKCRVAGNIFMQSFYDEERKKMDMFVGLSEGEISSVESVFADSYDLNAVDSDLEDCSYTLYYGTPGQIADPRGNGYAYANTAYLAMTLKAQENLSGNPTVTSVVNGKKVWTPAGVQFSRNPAWIIYDLITNTRYGVGIPEEYIDLSSFESVATYCDETVGTSGPRFTLDYVIDSQRPAMDILKDMLSCFCGYILSREKIELHVDKPEATAYKFIGEDSIVENSLQWWQKPANETVNRVVVEWVNPDNSYERVTNVFQDDADIMDRGIIENNYSLLGITRPSQAGRLGEYLLNVAQGAKNYCNFGLTLKDSDVEAGDIIALTHTMPGWLGKWFRVLDVEDNGDDTIRVTCVEYVSSAYVDDPDPVPIHDPDDPPETTDDITNLTLTQIPIQHADGSYGVDLKAIWALPGSFSPKHNVVKFQYTDDTSNWELHGRFDSYTRETRLTGLNENKTITVWVYAEKPSGGTTAGVTQTVNLDVDTTPPGAPTGLTTEGWFGNIRLYWTSPTDADMDYTQIWENTADDRSTAVQVGRALGDFYERYLGSFEGRYYWIRSVDRTGNVGPWNASAGTYGYSDQESHQDLVDAILENNPYLSDWIDEFNTDIDSVLGQLSDVVGVDIPNVDYNISEIIDGSISDINTDIGNINTDIDNIIDVEVPQAQAEITDQIGGLNEEIQDGLDWASTAIIDTMTQLSETEGRIRDAGIVEDPDTGTVRIWGIDQAEDHISQVELTIDAMESEITQRATYVEVDQRIAGAVFGDAGELLLEGVNVQINEVWSELDAQDARITQKASALEVEDQEARLSSAETVIDGLDASIISGAIVTDVDDNSTQISNAQSEIDAFEGSISNQITAFYTNTTYDDDLNAEAEINAMLNDRDNQDYANMQLAFARDELKAYVDEGVSAEASQRTDLATLVNSNYSEFVNEVRVRSDQDGVLATRITQLRAEAAAGSEENAEDIATNVAAINTEAIVRANSDESIAEQSHQLIAYGERDTDEGLVDTILNNADTAADYAVINRDLKVVQNGVESAATERSILAAKIDDAEATIVTEREARADVDSALARQTNTLQSTLNNTNAALQTEITTRATEDSALSSRIDTNVVSIGDNEAAIVTEREARADVDGALARQTNTLQSTLNNTNAALQTEITTRATEDSALSSRIDTNVVSIGDNEAAIATETETRIEEDEVLASQITTLQTGTVAGNTAAIENEAEVRSNADESLAQQSQTLIAYAERDTDEGLVDEVLNGAESAKNLAIIDKDLKVTQNDVEVEASERTVLAARLDDAESLIMQERIVRADIDGALARQTNVLQADFNEAHAAIETEQIVRADANMALSSRIDTAVSDIAGNASAIITEEETRANADESLAEQQQTLLAYGERDTDEGLVDEILNGAETAKNFAVIDKDLKVTQSDIEAEASERSTLAARLDQAESWITEERIARADVDGALARQTVNLQANYNDVNAAVQDEITTRATEDSAIASRVQVFETSLGTNSTSISESITSKSGILNSRVIKSDMNGNISGYGFVDRDDEGSTMYFNVNNFYVQNSNGTKSGAPFVINSEGKVSMDTAFIQDATITSAKIVDATLGTATIADHAISTIAFFYAYSHISIKNTWFKEIASKTISNVDTSKPITIFFSCIVFIWQACYGIKITINSDVVFIRDATDVGPNGPHYRDGYFTPSLIFKANPPSSSFTVHVYVNRLGRNFANQYASNRSLQIWNVKK